MSDVELWRPSGMPVPSYWPADFLLGRADITYALVGEAPGENEAKKGEPFVGGAGHELNSILADAGILRSECYIGNVFRHRPPGNAIEAFTLKKKEVQALDPNYSMPPLRAGAYVRPELLPELERLRAELGRAKPKIAIALGNTALWALCGRTGIGRIRGTVVESSLIPGLKVVPTYHPAAVLRDYSLRAVSVADILKAKREATYPDIRRPQRWLWIEPTLSDLEEFAGKYLATATRLSVDIETIPSKRLVQCIALATTTHALVIPFLDQDKPDWSYWDPEEEVLVHRFLRDWLTGAQPVGGQNFQYDWLWLYLEHKIPLKFDWDLLHKHHSIYLELPKTLDFMASLHTNELAWKLDRPRGFKVGKREE